MIIYRKFTNVKRLLVNLRISLYINKYTFYLLLILHNSRQKRTPPNGEVERKYKMKLNYDCLRKTLIVLEEDLTLRDDYSFQNIGISQIVDNLSISSEFDKKDIAYCVYMMINAELLEETPRSPD